ncbi:hypothetical protein MMC31_004356 [Peltigera leucophlebia]|nr:hypothetical protein [Peltigera leucophlebia]
MSEPKRITQVDSNERHYAKAALYVQNTVVREIVARDSIQQLIAFASTILVYPVKSEGRLFNEDTEGNHRLTRILDSIANISISQSKGEVVAVARSPISRYDTRTRCQLWRTKRITQADNKSRITQVEYGRRTFPYQVANLI